MICQRCNRERPHKAKGLCKTCYNYLISKKTGSNAKRVKRWRFSGLWEIQIVIESTCRSCGSDTNLLIHHVDCDKRHNELSNFATMCRVCHSRLHKLIWLKVKLKRYFEITGS